MRRAVLAGALLAWSAAAHGTSLAWACQDGAIVIAADAARYIIGTSETVEPTCKIRIVPGGALATAGVHSFDGETPIVEEGARALRRLGVGWALEDGAVALEDCIADRLLGVFGELRRADAKGAQQLLDLGIPESTFVAAGRTRDGRPALLIVRGCVADSGRGSFLAWAESRIIDACGPALYIDTLTPPALERAAARIVQRARARGIDGARVTVRALDELQRRAISVASVRVDAAGARWIEHGECGEEDDDHAP